MHFILSDEASQHVLESHAKIQEDLIMIIYQISKQACAGSYLDYYIELTSKKSLMSPELYEKSDMVEINNGIKIEVYIEKRILVDFQGIDYILIDVNIIKKFNENFISLILKEYK
ncbi:MAG: hypothetical protein EU532_09810 [Promethearchaeota archaeon]|nr:MAG: hypothetical protein EU532_09810 [Candidatus Lokiarchaeota archaeon]